MNAPGSFPAADPRPALSSATTRLLLAAIVALGLALRLIGLGSSFWVDEVDSLLHCIRLPLGELVTSYPSENQHPLYSLLAHVSVALLGESEGSARLPALLFGVGSIVALFALAKRVVGERTALVAALLMALSYHPVWFSQNARGYTGLLFFTLLGTNDFLVVIDPMQIAAERRRAAIRYSLWFALALYVHLTAGFAFAGHALVWLAGTLRRRDGADGKSGAKLPFLALAAGALLGLLLYAPMAGDVVKAFTARAAEQSVAVVKVTPWTRPGWAIEQLRANFGGSVLVAIGSLLLAALGLVGTLSLWKRARRFLLLQLLALPVGLVFLLALHRHLYPRFFFFEAGFLLITVAQGATATGEWLACVVRRCGPVGARRMAAAVGCFAASMAALELGRVYAAPKQDFTGARDWVEAHAAPTDARVAVGPAKLALPGFYAPSWSIAESAAGLAALRASAPRTWVVWCFPDQLAAAKPDIAEELQRDFELVETRPASMNGGEVVIARSR